MQWFCETPHRSLDRAHEASKQVLLTKEKYLSHARMESPPKELSEATLTEGFDLSFMIYWSLLEYRTSVFISSIIEKMNFFHYSQLSLLTSQYHTIKGTNVSSNNKNLIKEEKFDPGTLVSHYSGTPHSKSEYRGYQHSRDNGTIHIQSQIDYFAAADNSGTYTPTFISSKKYEQMNRKLVWIEAVLNASVEVGKCTVTSRLLDKDSNDIAVPKLTNLLLSASAYELTNLIPRSINRTPFNFGTELTSQSTPLVLHDFQLAKYQAAASLKTTGCLVIFFLLIHAILKNEFSEPWVEQLWNISQLQVFFNPFQEERASNQFRQTEGLRWLDGMTKSSVGLRLRNCNTNTCDGNIQSLIMYNKLNIQIVSCIVSDTISLAIPIFVLAVSRRRLAVLNPWIRELFHSSSDTMKASSIPSVTDPCVGFHSPQGWEIVTGCFLEHIGFARDRYVISRFVSTFPVISDTVSKYWIFRHPNRASPSIVATYHTTNE
nr:chloroplast envelope membrane protein [Schizaea tenella]